jgi:hypothetical protein
MPFPWFPWFPDDFPSHLLSCAEEGLYHRIIDSMWRYPGCRLPADFSSLFRILQLKKGSDWHWRAWLAKLISLQLLAVRNGYLYSDWLTSRHASAQDKSAKARAAAKAKPTTPPATPTATPLREPSEIQHESKICQILDSKQSRNNGRSTDAQPTLGHAFKITTEGVFNKDW